MGGSTELNALERRVATLADNLQAAKAQIGNLEYRLHQIEDALQTSADADKAHKLPTIVNRRSPIVNRKS
jgi:prefoldin subunit 5